MRTVYASVVIDASVHEAETAWLDTSRWENWVEGLEQITALDPRWPEAGATLEWRSNPAGRGHVSETVVDREPLEGLVSDIEDDYMRARQHVNFTPEGSRTAVTVTLSYEIRRRNPLTPLVDLLFVRRAFERSLQLTLGRFAAELRADN